MVHHLNLSERPWTKIFLWIGAGFFLMEFFLHFFGLAFLEHDRIFLYTHDRYIALYALTFAVLLFLVSLNIQQYRVLFYLIMVGFALAFINASFISFLGGYQILFPVVNLDGELPQLGYGFIAWYFLTWLVWAMKK